MASYRDRLNTKQAAAIRQPFLEKKNRMDKLDEYFTLIKDKIVTNARRQKEPVRLAAAMLGQTMADGGVIQLFGIGHGEEFVNELNFRAGGLAPFHALRLMDLALYGKVDRRAVDDGTLAGDDSCLDDLLGLYQLDARDAYVIVSETGTEPLAVSLAERVKAHGHRLIAVVAHVSDDVNSIQHQADLVLEMDHDVSDPALQIDGLRVGQVSSTLGNVLAQTLTAELYRWFQENQMEAPVLLSANLAGADAHNNALTDRYHGRVR